MGRVQVIFDLAPPIVTPVVTMNTCLIISQVGVVLKGSRYVMMGFNDDPTFLFCVGFYHSKEITVSIYL